MNGGGKVVVNLATGLEDTERVTVAFLVAGAALEKDKQVAMFLTKEAIRLAVAVGEGRARLRAFDPAEAAVAAARGARPASLAERLTFGVASAPVIEIPRCEGDIVLFSWSL